MDMVDLRSLSDYESLERDSWGIPTIPAATVGDREHILENPTGATGSLDMILMPGVAFDLDPKTSFVRRLGHGKGFYDYFLHRYMQDRGSLYSNKLSSSPGTDILLYGLALKEQLLKSETGSWVHGLVVGDGNILEGPLEE
jgi:5-formyltetrahydrofolate cyclo-ligase